MVYEINRQVLPTAPSPTTTHLSEVDSCQLTDIRGNAPRLLMPGELTLLGRTYLIVATTISATLLITYET